MAKANPKTRAPVSKRISTVTRSMAPGKAHPRLGDLHGARIRLDGHWVREAGFPQGAKIVVEIEHGRLVITRAPEPELPTCTGCASRVLKRHVHAHAVP